MEATARSRMSNVADPRRSSTATPTTRLINRFRRPTGGGGFVAELMDYAFLPSCQLCLIMLGGPIGRMLVTQGSGSIRSLGVPFRRGIGRPIVLCDQWICFGAWLLPDGEKCPRDWIAALFCAKVATVGATIYFGIEYLFRVAAGYRAI